MIYQTNPISSERNDGMSSLRLNRLAYYSPDFLQDPQMRVDFATNLTGQIVFDLPISISIQNSNRVPIARYTADGVAKSSQEVKEQISKELYKCRQQQADPIYFAKALWRLTTNTPEVSWRTESIYPGVRDPERELRPCIPSLDEFLRNPECINQSFYSVRNTPTVCERIEAKIDPASAKVSFTIILTPNEASSRDSYPQRFIIDCIPTLDGGGPDIHKDTVRKLVWETMEIFWSRGGIGVYQHLVTDTHSHNNDCTLPSFFNVQHFFYTGQAKVGAYLSMEASPHIAQLSITQRPSDHTNQGYSQSGSVQIVFTSDDTTKADSSNLSPNPIQNKFERGLIRLIKSSGEYALEKALTELLMNARSEVYARPSTKEVLGEGALNILSCLSRTKVRTAWNPSISELVGFLEGVQSIELHLNTNKLKNHLVLFDTLRIDALRDNTRALQCTNPLGIKVETHFQKLSDHDLGLILKAFDNQINSAGTMDLLTLLNQLVSEDPESWMVSTGPSTLPTCDDIVGQQLLEQIALPIINQYLRLRAIREHVEYSEKSNLTLRFVDPGALELSLGEDYHPYQIRFSLKDLGLTSIQIIRQSESPAMLKNSRIYTYETPRPINDDRIEKFFETSLQLFFALIAPNQKGSIFANSQLRGFLDREFQ